MVDFQDPATVARDFITLLRFWHVVNGIFIWEFFTTLNYEWDVLRGNRPYRWTICVYSTARVSTLLAVILNMFGFDSTTPINCQVWVVFEMIFAYLALASASLLIVLRIIAIWNRNKIVIAIAMSIWLTDIAIIIDGNVRARSTWSPVASTCLPLNFQSTKLATFAVLFTDVMLLLIMLMGLLRMRLEAGDIFGLGHVLWKQGLLWLLIATIAEVPPTALMILNLNVPLTLITQTPSMIIVTIAATRMYRSLVNFASSENSHGIPRGERTVSEMRVRSGPIPLSLMEVTVRTERDQFSVSQSLYVSTDQEGYKTHEVSLSGDVESGQEK